MKILNDIIRGASSQFGREFGRAGANVILKGKNAYHITGDSKYESRIKPSDTDLIKAIKNIKKTKFSATDKSNIIKILEIQNEIINHLEFIGLTSIYEAPDINFLINEYESKYDLGLSLIENPTEKLLEKIKKITTKLTPKLSPLTKS